MDDSICNLTAKNLNLADHMQPIRVHVGWFLPSQGCPLWARERGAEAESCLGGGWRHSGTT